ncbi:hypothetical protein BGX34_000812 [Mortierella sp. NVP85]|nr:hypothetical protein BGX34_000812 [Mortierella sp. NVP85]
MASLELKRCEYRALVDSLQCGSMQCGLKMELSKIQDAYNVYSEYHDCLEQVLDNFIFFRMLKCFFSAGHLPHVVPRLIDFVKDCTEIVKYREAQLPNATSLQHIARLQDEELFAIHLRDSLNQTIREPSSCNCDSASSSSKVQRRANPTRPVIPSFPRPKSRRSEQLATQTILSRLAKVEEDIIRFKTNTIKNPLDPLQSVSSLDELALIAIQTRNLAEASLAIMEADLLYSDLDSMHHMVRYHNTQFENRTARKIRLKKLKEAQWEAREKAIMLNRFKQSGRRINTLVSERNLEIDDSTEGEDSNIEDETYTLCRVKEDQRGPNANPIVIESSDKEDEANTLYHVKEEQVGCGIGFSNGNPIVIEGGEESEDTDQWEYASSSDSEDEMPQKESEIKLQMDQDGDES